MDPLIRPFAAADWPAAWEIIRPVFRAGETYPFPPDISEAAAREIWTAPPAESRVAIAKNGAIVGAYYIKPNQPGLGSHVCNCGYVVAESARRRGVGALLCAHSLRQAAALGYRAMQYNLVVATNKAALRTWKSAGFDMVGRLPEAFQHPRLGFVDAFIMRKDLAPKTAAGGYPDSNAAG